MHPLTRLSSRDLCSIGGGIRARPDTLLPLLARLPPRGRGPTVKRGTHQRHRAGGQNIILTGRLLLSSMRALTLQFVHRLGEFFVEVADHVIKGDVLLALGLQEFFMLDEPGVNLITHLDRLHKPPLCAPLG